MKSPIGWPGGKTKLASKIVAYFPEHVRYVEPFMGSLAVLLAKPKQTSTIEIANDLHGEVVNFFSVLRDKPKEFVRQFRWDLVSEQMWNYYRTQMFGTALSDVERAHHFYYIIRLSYGQRYGDVFGVHTDSRVSPLRLEEIKAITRRLHRRLRGVYVYNRPYTWMKKFDHADTLFYLDPPYLGTTIDGYAGKALGLKKFWRWCNSLKGQVLISHEANKRFEKAFADWHNVEVGERVTSLTCKGKCLRASELLFANFPLANKRVGLFDK